MLNSPGQIGPEHLEPLLLVQLSHELRVEESEDACRDLAGAEELREVLKGGAAGGGGGGGGGLNRAAVAVLTKMERR